MSQFALGVVGYSHWNLNISRARRLVSKGIRHVLAHSSLPKGTEIVLVSGLTNFGIPALAYKYAEAQQGWKTVGIACKKAKTMKCCPVTEKPIYVGNNWGDESDTFLEYLLKADYRAMLRIGGGPQSFDEVAKFVEQGGTVYEYELPCYPRNK